MSNLNYPFHQSIEKTSQKITTKAVGKRAWGEGARFWFFIAIVASSIFLLFTSPSLFPSILISLLIFFIFNPIIDAAERKGIVRSHAITVLFLVFGVTIWFSATSWIAPKIIEEIQSFQISSDRYASHIEERLKIHESKLAEKIPLFRNVNLTEKTFNWLYKSSEKAWSIVLELASHFALGLLLIPLLSFFLLNDAHEIRRTILKLVPNRYFETSYGLISRILDKMGGYFSARILEAALLGLIVTIGFLIAGVPYAILLGLFAAATNAIPYLGPLLGALPGLALGLLEPSLQNDLFVIFLIYFVANMVDMFLVFPVLVAKIVDLHPLVVILSVVLGSQWFGIPGMIIAVPVTSILKILVQEIYSRLYPHSRNF